MLGKKIKRDLNESNKNKQSSATNSNGHSNGHSNQNSNKTFSEIDKNIKKFNLKKNKNKKEKMEDLNKKEGNQKIKIIESSFYKDEDGIDLLDEEDKINEEKLQAKINSDNSIEGKWINKQRLLVVASRGVSHQERYLVNDILGLLPHAKKECKIEKNTAREELNDICFNHSCKSSLYFEHRKRELVMWLFRSPEGPCAKFQIKNIHTLNEIKLNGNCLKYSRPLLSFDKSFEEKPHLKLLKEMFHHAFNNPKNHPKTKPFYDHVISFYNVNNQIFFRNYQMVNELKDKFCDGDDVDKLQLIEIGPRFSMNLMRIFDGPLGGTTLYQNPFYISPALTRRRNAEKYKMRNLKSTEKKMNLEKQIENAPDEKYKWMNKD